MYKSLEKGRSMIEMLGVLAIIGVLSVVGIAGYSKAMEIYKSNLQRNTLAELLHNMIKIKDQFNKNMESRDIADILYAMGETPKSLHYKQSANGFIDIDNNVIDPQYGFSNAHGKLRYTIYIFLSQNSKNLTITARNYCYNLALAAQTIADDVIQIYVYYGSSNPNKPNGESKTIFNSKNLKNPSIAQIHQICDNSLPDDATRISHFTISLNPN